MIVSIASKLNGQACKVSELNRSENVVKLDTIREVLDKFLDCPEYEDGVHECWEIARLVCNTKYDECREIFGDSSVENMIRKFSPIYVRDKIIEYQESKEIHVGDVVNTTSIVGETHRGIVTQITSTQDNVCILHTDGSVSVVNCSMIEKTGFNLDIESLFTQMEEC